MDDDASFFPDNDADELPKPRKAGEGHKEVLRVWTDVEGAESHTLTLRSDILDAEDLAIILHKIAETFIAGCCEGRTVSSEQRAIALYGLLHMTLRHADPDGEIEAGLEETPSPSTPAGGEVAYGEHPNELVLPKSVYAHDDAEHVVTVWQVPELHCDDCGQDHKAETYIGLAESAFTPEEFGSLLFALTESYAINLRDPIEMLKAKALIEGRFHTLMSQGMPRA